MYQQHWTASITPLMAVGVALLLGVGLIWASGASVLEAYGGLFAGMCGSWQALSETGVAATPYTWFRSGLDRGETRRTAEGPT